MKKFFLFAVIALSLLTVVSCDRKKEMKQMKGVVTKIKIIKDSLATARVANGADTVLFKLADARLVNGMFINGDSVHVDYIEGRDDTLHALVISVLPRSVHYIDLNDSAEKSDTIVTRPSAPEGQE